MTGGLADRRWSSDDATAAWGYCLRVTGGDSERRQPRGSHGAPGGRGGGWAVRLLKVGSPPASDKIQLQVCDTPQGERHTETATTVSEDERANAVTLGRC